MLPWRRPPVVVLGMHRSGTSLLAELLHDLGCWMFKARDRAPHGESRYFLKLDEGLLREWGAAWCRPGPALERLRDPAAVEAAAERLRREVRARLASRHFGTEYLRRSLAGRWRAWGFKDPRATLLYPVWARVFPEARALHVLRDGRDVALSILRREAELSRTPARQERLEGGFAAAWSLWETHVREGLRHEEALGERCLRLRYEDLQEEPEAHLRRILAHLGLDAPAAAVGDAARRVRPRAPRDAGQWAEEVAAARSPLAASLGYR